jgi:hypothetical protein
MLLLWFWVHWLGCALLPQLLWLLLPLFAALPLTDPTPARRQSSNSQLIGIAQQPTNTMC